MTFTSILTTNTSIQNCHHPLLQSTFEPNKKNFSAIDLAIILWAAPRTGTELYQM